MGVSYQLTRNLLRHQGSGCYYDSSVLTSSEVLAMEIAADFIIL